MSAKSDAWENALMLLLFNNTNAANIGDATGLRGATTAGSFFIALHTADPGEAGNQTTNEISYTGYARVAVARSGSGWTVTAGAATNAAEIAFGACTAGSGTATHFSVGTASSGTGSIVYSAALTASRAISAGITPRFAATTLTVTEA